MIFTSSLIDFYKKFHLELILHHFQLIPLDSLYYFYYKVLGKTL